MSKKYVQQCLECWGEFAFFGNSIYGANRRSYEIPTPSAVVGIFESIYWKPCIKWVADEILILSPIKYMTLMRNELRSRACDMMGKSKLGSLLYDWGDKSLCNELAKDVKRKLSKDVFVSDGDEKYLDEDVLREYVYREVDASDLGLYATDMHKLSDYKKERVQRCDKVLKDVRYRFIAHLEYDESQETAPGCNYYKHVGIFERRAKGGKCFRQPYFGCREFPAFFRWVDLTDPNTRISPSEIKDNTPSYRGIMHYGFKWDKTTGKPIPFDYQPYISGGRILVSSASCRECIEREGDGVIEPNEGEDAYPVITARKQDK